MHLLNLRAVPGHDVHPAAAQGTGQLNWAEPIHEVVPARDLRLHVAVAGEVERVYLAPGQDDLAHTTENGNVTVTVPRVDYHAMVVFETSP